MASVSRRYSALVDVVGDIHLVASSSMYALDQTLLSRER